MIYDRIIAQSRNPIFYTNMGVPDDLNGRYNMIVIHLLIFFTSIKNYDGNDARELRQNIFVRFIREMETMVRDFGLEEEHVEPEIRNITNLCLKQIEAYENAAINGGKEALSREILDQFRRTHGDTSIDADALAEYILDSVANIQAQPLDAILKGQMEFRA